MGRAFELFANFVQIFIWTWFMTKFFGFKKSGRSGIFGFVITWLLTFFEISFINNIVVYDGLLSGILIITFILYANLFLKGNWQFHIFIAIFSTAIIFTIGSSMIFLLSYFTGNNTTSLIIDFTKFRIIGVTLCRVCEIIVFKFIIKINTQYSLTKKEWTLFIAMPLLTWIAVTLMTNATIVSQKVLPYMICIALIVILINILIYFFMLKIKQDTDTKIQFELLKMQYDNVKNTENNMKALYENTYSLKHDLEKHFLAIKAMSEKNNNQEINNYIDNIFDKNLNAVQKVVFTDNDVFNAIVNTKLEICAQKKIFPSINVSNDAVSLIKTNDMAVLFGNILDNAIEATEKADRKIIVLTVQVQGEYVSIYTENTYNPNYSNLNSKTTKKNKSKHGFGTKNIKKIVDENGGLIQSFENERGMFCCDILLKK